MLKKKNCYDGKFLFFTLICFLLTTAPTDIFAQDQNIFLVSNDSSQAHNDSFKKRDLKPASLIIPVGLISYGALKPLLKGIENIDENIYTNILTHHPNFHTNAEDYLMWVPSASIYALDALGVKTKHNFKEHLILEAGSVIITGGLGYAMRLITKPITIYNTHTTKFPSGHTANAFRGAEIWHQELKATNSLLSYGGYVVATSVGVLRIYNKDHLLTQVLAGAGLGLLSTKLTYWVFNKWNNKVSKY